MKDSKQRGFTIIEVMIVLAIVGVIVLILFLSIGPAQRSNRDGSRKNVAGKIAAAIPQYAADNSGDYSGFSCTTYCDGINDPDTDSNIPASGVVGDSATSTSGVIFVIGGVCGTGTDVGKAVAGTAKSYAVLYWLEADETSHCLGGGTAGSEAAAAVPAPPPLVVPPGPPPPPADTPQTRDATRIAELSRLHSALLSFKTTNGYLPYTADYGEVDTGGWDYSSTGGAPDVFLPVLDSYLTPALDTTSVNNGSGDLFYCTGGVQTYPPNSPCAGNGYGYFCYATSRGWGIDGTTLGAVLEDPSVYAGDPHISGSVYYELYQQDIGPCGGFPAASINGSQYSGCTRGSCGVSGNSVYDCSSYYVDYSSTGILAGSNRLTLNFADHDCGAPTPPSSLYQFNVNVYVNGSLVAANQQLDPAGGRAVISLGVTPANPTIRIEWNNNYWVTDDPNNPYKYDPDFQINSLGVGP